MRRSGVALAAVAIAATVAVVAFAALHSTGDDDEPAAEACRDSVYGYVSTLTPGDDGYELRFDPAWFTVGVTANTAAAEDGVVEPGEPVPNDYYRINETDRLLTFRVAEDAEVTVLTAGVVSTPISVAELAQLLGGEKPVELFEPLDTGFRMQLDGDTVCALHQQYVP